MNFFLWSLLKPIGKPLSLYRYWGKVILISFLTAFLLQSAVSLVLNLTKKNILKQAAATLGYRISLNSLSFSFLKGLRLRGLSIYFAAQKEPSVSVQDTFIGVKIFPLFTGKIVLGVSVNESTLSVKREKEGYNIQIIFSDMAKNITEAGSPLGITGIDKIIMRAKTCRMVYADNEELRENMDIQYKNTGIIFYKSGKLKFDSRIRFKYRIPKYISGILKTDRIEQDLKCSLQGTLYGRNLTVDMLLVGISKDQIIGTGTVKDFTERNPFVDIDFVQSSLNLKNVAFLNDNFQAQGNIFMSLKFRGLMDDIKPTLSGRLNDCYFKHLFSKEESWEFKDSNGELEYKDNRIRLDFSFLNSAGLPLNIKFSTALTYDPDIYLSLYLSKGFFSPRNIPLNKLEANFKGKIRDTINGDLEVKALYTKRGINLNLGAAFKKISFDYHNPQGKYFKAEAVELAKKDISLTQKLMLDELSCKVISGKDKLAIKDIYISSYGSALGGEMDFDLKKPYLTGALSGLNLDVNKIMRDTNITDKLLSGKLDIKIIFDSRKNDFLKGRCYIKEGVVDLDILGNAVKFPSLKRTNVDIMNTYFMFSKDLIKIRGIKLYSRDIMLNAFWDINEKISGALNIKIASAVLNQSVSFRKLLNLADMKKPSVGFKFLIGGYLRAARIMWMKGEFKEKLEQGLPAWAKRSLQTNLNKAIDEVSAKQ